MTCSSGWEAQREPASWSEPVVGPKATGKCTGVCDDDIAACFCNGTFANPELPRTGPPTRYDLKMGLLNALHSHACWSVGLHARA